MSIFRLYGTARFAKIDIFDKELWVLSGLIVFLLIDKSISHAAPKFKVNSLLVVGIQPIRKRERKPGDRGDGIRRRRPYCHYLTVTFPSFKSGSK